MNKLLIFAGHSLKQPGAYCKLPGYENKDEHILVSELLEHLDNKLQERYLYKGLQLYYNHEFSLADKRKIILKECKIQDNIKPIVLDLHFNSYSPTTKPIMVGSHNYYKAIHYEPSGIEMICHSKDRDSQLYCDKVWKDWECQARLGGAFKIFYKKRRTISNPIYDRYAWCQLPSWCISVMIELAFINDPYRGRMLLDNKSLIFGIFSGLYKP
jgi:hypothetical protein